MTDEETLAWHAAYQGCLDEGCDCEPDIRVHEVLMNVWATRIEHEAHCTVLKVQRADTN